MNNKNSTFKTQLLSFSLLIVLLFCVPLKADILVATGSDIIRLNSDGTNPTTFATGATYGMYYDSITEKLYYTGTSDSIKRVDRDGSNPVTLVSGAGSTIVDIVIDHTTSPNKIIWTDTNGFRIRRCNLDGTSVENLINGISEPREIAIDSGILYWSDALGISSSNLDGTNQNLSFITDFGGPIQYFIISGGKIYWTNALDNTVKRADLNGSNKVTLNSTDVAGAQGIGYDSTLGKLFIIGNPSGGVGLRKMDIDGMNTVTLGSQKGYDIIVDYSTASFTPTPTPTNTSTPTVTPTNTNTATATLTPANTRIPTMTPSPSPTVMPPVSMPASLCFKRNQDKDFINDFLGTYTLQSSSGTSFVYKHNNQYITLIGDFLKSAYLSFHNITYAGYVYSISPNTAPLGYYSGTLKGKKVNRYVSFLAQEGPCPEITPTPLPTNKISGQVTTTSPNSVKSLATSDNLYALLYSGANPDEADNSGLPLAGVLVNSDGTFEFSNIVLGDYFIKFISDDVKFNAPYFSVSALTEGTTTVPSIAARIINYKDTGCTIKNLGTAVYYTTSYITDMKNTILKQIGYNETVGYKILKASKLSTFIKSIEKIKTQAEKFNLAAVKVASGLSITNRSKCPTVNKCTKKNLTSSLKTISTNIEKLKLQGISIKALATKLALGNSAYSTNAKYLTTFNNFYKKAVKQIAVIPKENNICPEA